MEKRIHIGCNPSEAIVYYCEFLRNIHRWIKMFVQILIDEYTTRFLTEQ